MSSEKLVIGVTGMPGSGKSIVLNVALQSSYESVIMGDEVREETRKRGLSPTPENIGKIMIELRQTEGEAVIAKRCLPKIEKTARQKVAVDGIRSLSEVEEFRKSIKNFTLIAVHSSPETRFKRLFNRQRSDDPKGWMVFRERDLRELGVGLGNAIAMSEYIIVNEGELNRTKEDVKAVLKKVEAKWMK
ncbi:MAG TPA: AAA family ATPase [Candidatus Acidoferrum sp.]|jgi:dephospho-CoA kinase|nr:AAA family ATPase [Candidatus Acidoferrum sp.]